MSSVREKIPADADCVSVADSRQPDCAVRSNGDLYVTTSPAVRAVARWLRNSNRNPAALRLSTGLNRAIMLAGAHWLGSLEGVRTVLARHSATTEDFVPWFSDLDLNLVLDDRVADTAAAQKAWAAFARLKSVMPMFGELEVCSAAELCRWREWGGIEAQEVEGWWRLCGERLPKTPAPRDASPMLFNINRGVATFNMLYWQLHGQLFSPRFDGTHFVKAFLKVWHLLCLPDDNPQPWILETRRKTRARLAEQEPELASILTRIEGREFVRVERDIQDVLQILFERLVVLLPEAPRVKSLSLLLRRNHARETLPWVTGPLGPALEAIAAIDGVHRCHLISGRMGDSGAVGNYDYKLYVVLAPGQLGRWAKVVTQVREVFDMHRGRWPFSYFGACSLPMVVTPEAFSFATNVWDPIEGAELGTTMGDTRRELPLFIERSLAHYTNVCRHYRGFATNRPFQDRVREDWGPELTTVDLVFTLVQTRLALEHGVLPLTPLDIVETYCDMLPSPRELGAQLSTVYQRYGALAPGQMDSAFRRKDLVTQIAPFVDRQRRAIESWIANYHGLAPTAAERRP